MSSTEIAVKIDEPLLERLRSKMVAAPDYQADDGQRNEYDRTYRFGAYESTEESAGIIIAEEIVPEQELVDKNNNPDYGHSTLAMSSYMCANSFVHIMPGNLGLALRGLGYGGVAIPTDQRGSRLIVATHPTVNDLNRRMQAIDDTAFEVTEVEKGIAYKPLPVAEAAREGKLLTDGGLHMLMNVSMLSLLDPSVWAQFQARLQAEAGRDQSIMSEYQTVSRRLSSMSTVTFSRYLVNGVTDPYEGRVTPTGVQELGYELNNALRTEHAELVDYGYSLATKTVEHIRKSSLQKWTNGLSDKLY